jgi:hypothetical protein
MPQHAARTVVAGLHAHRALEALHGLEVVVENVGPGVEHGVDVLQLALEVRNEHLDRGGRVAMAHGADRRGPDRGSAVGEFVAGHTGDDAVAQAHGGDCFGHAGRLAKVEFGGPPGLDRAEVAGAGADIAQDHQGGRAAGPALAKVRAFRALADGVEPVRIHELPHGLVAGAAGYLCPEPRGFAGNFHGQGAGRNLSR